MKKYIYILCLSLLAKHTKAANSNDIRDYRAYQNFINQNNHVPYSQNQQNQSLQRSNLQQLSHFDTGTFHNLSNIKKKEKNIWMQCRQNFCPSNPRWTANAKDNIWNEIEKGTKCPNCNVDGVRFNSNDWNGYSPFGKAQGANTESSDIGCALYVCTTMLVGKNNEYCVYNPLHINFEGAIIHNPKEKILRYCRACKKSGLLKVESCFFQNPLEGQRNFLQETLSGLQGHFKRYTNSQKSKESIESIKGDVNCFINNAKANRSLSKNHHIFIKNAIENIAKEYIEHINQNTFTSWQHLEGISNSVKSGARSYESLQKDPGGLIKCFRIRYRFDYGNEKERYRIFRTYSTISTSTTVKELKSLVKNTMQEKFHSNILSNVLDFNLYKKPNDIYHAVNSNKLYDTSKNLAHYGIFADGVFLYLDIIMKA